MKKRLMALLLTLAMVATFMPAMALTAFAGETRDITFSATCGSTTVTAGNTLDVEAGSDVTFTYGYKTQDHQSKLQKWGNNGYKDVEGARPSADYKTTTYTIENVSNSDAGSYRAKRASQWDDYSKTISIKVYTPYTITFDPNGGNWGGSTDAIEKKTNADKKVADWPDAPEKEGYTFIGWYKGETKYSPNNLFNDDTELKAQYVKTPVVTIDKRDGSEPKAAEVIYTDGKFIIYKPENPSVEGKTQLLDWYRDADLTQKVTWYGNYYKYLVVAKDTTLYAKYFRVALDPNYEGTEIDYADMVFEKDNHGKYRAKKPADLTRDGYTFLGWFDAKEGGKQWKFEGISKFGYNYEPIENKGEYTLYAQWEAIPAEEPIINAEGQPKDVVMAADESGELVVGASKAAADDELTYQWYKDGEAIDGATESTYTVPVDTAAGQYEFYCVVTATNKYNGTTASVPTDVATVTAENPVIEGTQKTTKVEGKKSEVTFTSNAPYDTFKEVRVDGQRLSEDNYTVKEGSTIVTLKPEYVSTLKVGVHEVEIVSARGSASAELKIVPEEKGVSTGDAENLMLWMMMAVAAMVAAGYAVSRKEN